MKVPAKEGSLEIQEVKESARCDECGVRGGGMTHFETVTALMEGVDRVVTATLCGSCIANCVFPIEDSGNRGM